MRTVLLLALLALPAYAADEPIPDILISGDERQAIIEKFGQMAGAIEKLDKALTNCRTAQRT